MKNLLLILLTTIFFSGFEVGQSLVCDFYDRDGEIDSNTLGAGITASDLGLASVGGTENNTSYQTSPTPGDARRFYAAILL